MHEYPLFFANLFMRRYRRPTRANWSHDKLALNLNPPRGQRGFACKYCKGYANIFGAEIVPVAVLPKKKEAPFLTPLAKD